MNKDEQIKTAFVCNSIIHLLRNGGSIGEISDGYHTFDELYHHRAVLTAALMALLPRDMVWKSKQHDDPDFPMYNGMFICGINTPEGQVTYHYDLIPYWPLFDVPELEKAPIYDGHTSDVAISRIAHMIDPSWNYEVKGGMETW